MADKVIREVFLDYDRLDGYDQGILRLLINSKMSPVRFFTDGMEMCFKRRNRIGVQVVYYLVNLDSEDLVWIKLTAPEIILKEVSTSL